MSRSSMEPQTPLAGFTSKKRVYMDADVIEIPPPVSRTQKVPKQKEVILYEVIDVDNYEDGADVMVLDEKIDSKNKGKAVKHESDGSGNYQSKEALANHRFSRAGVDIFGSVNGVGSSKSSAPGSDNLINLDSKLSREDEYTDIYPDDDFMDLDRYAMLQAHFDSMDIPAGVEATVPWLPDISQSENKTVTGSDSFYMQGQMQFDHGINMSPSPWSSNPTHPDMNSIAGTDLSLQTTLVASSNPGELDLSSPWSLPQTAYSNKNSDSSLHRGFLKHPYAAESLESQLLSLQRKKKPVNSSSSTHYSSVKQLDPTIHSFGVETTSWRPHAPNILNKQSDPSDLAFSNFPAEMINYPSALIPPTNWFPSAFINGIKSAIGNFPNVYDPFDVPPEDEIHMGWGPDSTRQDSTRNRKTVEVNDILRKFQEFKKFDTVEDHSDHHYASKGSSMKQPSKNCAKRIQEEWRILEKDLPDTIFVRVYESRMDLLRAVIVGAEGTPYHDGLFFFDVLFPDSYPHVPPLVYYHSGGLRLNPNLYNCGKVCLSLLNTWSGNKNEMWIPGMSTMLQVLVSIQALILNQKPFFNEPGYAGMSGSENGEVRSQQYNESTFILSLRTMLYTMRRPPKHFDDFVVGHFYKRAHDILVACKAYMDGAQVGCLVKGGVQDVDAGDKSCSKKFKHSLGGYVNMLVKEFTQIGVKDCEKFLTQAKKGNNQAGILTPAENGNNQVGNTPKAAK